MAPNIAGHESEVQRFDMGEPLAIILPASTWKQRETEGFEEHY